MSEEKNNKIINIIPEKKVKKGKMRKREVVILLIVTLIISFFISGYSMGKGVSQTKVNTEAQIAKPILEVENNPDITITKNNNKGTYDFKVKNYNMNEEITQIDLLYTIEILTKTQDEISFKLYKNDKEVSLEENKSQEMLLTKNEKQEDNYKLEILYNNSSGLEKDIFQDVQIKVHTEQRKI